MTDEEKEPYVKLQEKDIARHQKQMEEYEKNGYYTRPDGTKSNDGVSKKTKDEEPEEVKPAKKKMSKAREAKKKEKEQKDKEHSQRSPTPRKSESPTKNDEQLLFDEDSWDVFQLKLDKVSLNKRIFKLYIQLQLYLSNYMFPNCI